MKTLFKRIGTATMLGALSISLAACGNDPTAVVPTATVPAINTLVTAAPATALPDSTPTTSAASESAPTASEPTATAPSVSTSTSTKLNLNTVTEAELMSTIPNFPSRMVREFQEYRPYTSIQQFRREIGKYVDQSQVTTWEKYVYVPVSPNDSDAETLMQLPGVTDTIAQSLISGRPYASNSAFLEALGNQVSADQATQAKTYLANE